METEHVKIFTGSFIIIHGLKNILEQNNINTLVKDRFESARLGGYGENRSSVELFVLSADVEKAQPMVDAYKIEINS
ncbi:DUF2007 domain-containing protein [uncultured Polaribacter sp.]|uniref:putative signal transducing protein n=1 Tax=uncultured Polaribacter sp. TaxID=174711 RepID=UPI002624C7A4|nr:DUF2007 domain-containing protein [uncultured Polaribacter sp.]